MKSRIQSVVMDGRTKIGGRGKGFKLDVVFEIRAFTQFSAPVPLTAAVLQQVLGGSGWMGGVIQSCHASSCIFSQQSEQLFEKNNNLKLSSPPFDEGVSFRPPAWTIPTSRNGLGFPNTSG